MLVFIGGAVGTVLREFSMLMVPNLADNFPRTISIFGRGVRHRAEQRMTRQAARSQRLARSSPMLARGSILPV